MASRSNNSSSSSSERASLNVHTNTVFPLYFPLEGEYDFPEGLLGAFLSRDELASTIGGARNVYAQTSLNCLYYSLIPSFLLCLCFCVVPLICVFEKKVCVFVLQPCFATTNERDTHTTQRDRNVREFLERCNEATFEARGVRFELEVRNGNVWIVVDRCCCTTPRTSTSAV